MDKAITIGFELLMMLVLLGLTAIALTAPWPFQLGAVLSLGGVVLIAMMIFDIART